MCGRLDAGEPTSVASGSSDVSNVLSQPLHADMMTCNAPLRKRIDGPVTTRKKTRGSQRAAMLVSSNPETLTAAVASFDGLTYAPNTLRSKSAKQGLFEKICITAGLDRQLFTPQIVYTVAAVLRAAGYSSGYSYLLEAKQTFVRNGGVITQSTALALEKVNVR